MKISVVTVCRNAESELEKTIISVLNQDYMDFEYIIKDGNSQDNTMNIVKKYQDDFRQKNITYLYEVSKDSGIYSAMNQALKLCSGEWVIFLNAGDVFFDSGVLSKAMDYANPQKWDIIYGLTYYVLGEKSKVIVQRCHDDIPRGLGICQQSYFVRTNLLKNRMFKEEFKILADYEYLCYLYYNQYRFKFMNMIVSKYDTTGISSTNAVDVYKESIEIRNIYTSVRAQANKIIILYQMVRGWIIKRFPKLQGWHINFKEMKR